MPFDLKRQAAVLLLFAFACSSPPQGAQVKVSVSPSTASLLPGAAQQFLASVSVTGTGAASTQVTWAVQEGAGGVISEGGLYTAPSAAGTFHVVATSVADPSATATATVTVTSTPAVAVSISPATTSVQSGTTQQFGATVTGSTNTAVTWAVQEGATGGSISAGGLYIAPAGTGTFHVVATSVADASRSAIATVTVTSAPAVAVAVSPATATIQSGATQQFTASVTGSANTAVTWSVQEGAGGSVSAGGTYTAPAGTGTFHVVAVSVADPSATATATVTVTSTPVVAVSVSPATASVQSGTTQQFVATVTGSTNTAVTWSVQEGATGGAVSAAGHYTAPAGTGTFHVVATSVADASKSATATVTVTSTPVVAVSISPATASLLTGASQQFTATVTGSSNTAVTWSVQEGAAGGSVSASGLYTAPATAGTFHVVATSVADALQSAAATVAVTTAPVVTVALTPTTTSLLTNASAWFAATVTGSANTQVTWSVQEGAAGGTVSTIGYYTAPGGAGTYHVVATSVADATKSASATVTVTAPPVAITIAPTSATVAPGAVYAFTATLANTTNTAVTWRVQEATGGAVSAAGNYTAPQAIGIYHVIATSVADPTKSATATALVCSSGVLCTPANPCHTGSTSCPASGQSCMDSNTNAPNGTGCGTNSVCNAGACVACTAGVSCTSLDPCALGLTSCTTGTSQCVAGGPNPAKPNGSSCTPTPIATGGGACQGGACTCPAGSAYYQGDCAACPAFTGTTVEVNADPTKGSDNACCGTSTTPGFGGPCLTITQAYKNAGTNWSISVTPDVLGNVSAQETYPIHLGKGVNLNLGTSYVRGASGRNIFAVDVDTARVSINGGTLGIDSGGSSAGAVDAIYVGPTSTGAQADVHVTWPTIVGVTNGIHVDGAIAGSVMFSADRIANAAVLCRSDTRPANASTMGNQTFGWGASVSVTAARYAFFGGQNCTVANGSVTAGPIGVCPSPKPLQYGVWLEGSAQFSGSANVTCANVDGVSLRTNPALTANNPQANLSNGATLTHNGCAGLYVETGKATVQSATIRNNHFGVWVSSAGSSIDPALAPVYLNGQNGTTFSRSSLLCNSAAEPGQCSTGAYATKGFSFFNSSGYTIDASNNYWGDSPISKCSCNSLLASCTCTGSAFGQTTPPDGLSIENSPYNASTTGAPAVLTTGYALDPTPTCN